MKNKFRFRFGKTTLISGFLGSIGYFLVNDLKKENSLIRNTFRKLFYAKREAIKDDNKIQVDSNNIRVINEFNQKK